MSTTCQETPPLEITKKIWDGLAKKDKRVHKDGAHFVFQKSPGGGGVWISVFWTK